MAAPKAPKEKKKHEKKQETGILSIRRALTDNEKIGCLQFLHQLLKKLVGTEDPIGRIITPCIKVELMGEYYEGLLPYQIAFLLFNPFVPIGKEISHRCCHERKSTDAHASPCINPLHMELATRVQNRGRDKHQSALLRWVKSNTKRLGTENFSGPIFFKWVDATKTKGIGWTGRLMKSCCRHIVTGDACFHNFREYRPRKKGLVFFDEPAELKKLIKIVNAMFENAQNE